MIDVVFRRLRDSAHPVDVVFGEPAGPVVDAAGALDIALPSFTPSFEGLLDYDLAVSGSDVIGTASSWQPAVAVIAPTLRTRHATGQRSRIACRAPWGRGKRVVGDLRSAWQQLDSIITHLRPGWQSGELLRFAAGSGWQHGTPTPLAARSPWQAGIPTRTGAAGGWSVADILPARPRGLPWGTALPTPVRVQASAQSGASVWQRPMRIRWTGTEPLPTGRSVIILPPVEPPWRCYTPPLGGAVHLLFDQRRPVSLDILFSCGADTPSGTVVIPVLRYYIVINSASLTRVSNGLPLPVTGLSMSIDSDSAHWTWSGSLPLRALSDLERDTPDQPVELEAVINGLAWRLILTTVREAERFGGSSLQIGGRGIAAELSDPIYPAVSHDNVAAAATAQQLAAAALSINGVPLGWSLDWQAPDWLVPASAWVHNGTPLDAVVRIAAAAGAYVQASPAARTLRVLPRYPVAPWEWAGATPAVVLPAAAVLERGADHVDRAGYNVVYVSGQADGILARVKRAGTAGDRPAQMIVDGLITHADAARGRGLEVLGNTGAQQIVSLETGILPASGLIHVGTLMDWTRGAASQRGLVRSLAVSATVPTGASRDPVKVRQNIGVEIHG